MSERYLTILEVSQKQAYIFSSNELKQNVERSDEIAWVTSPDYFRTLQGGVWKKDDSSLVYAGGGHTVLVFDDEESAKAFNAAVTQQIMRDFPEMEVFAKTLRYDYAISPSENLTHLTQALERKKATRRASFHQGSFGIERIDANTLKPVLVQEGTVRAPAMDSMIPAPYQPVWKFGELGGTKDKSNFIAVVHIDGNGMGKRVAEYYQKLDKETLIEEEHNKGEQRGKVQGEQTPDEKAQGERGQNGKEQEWDFAQFCKAVQTFSQAIDQDYKDAFREMNEEIKNSQAIEQLSLRGKAFPVRRIITSGDDICFVTEGRIGLEAARIFLEKLTAKTNRIDGEPYAACAGVAIVHQKYPFYRAYELAEQLCSNAKSFGAQLDPADNGRRVSSIDWHIEFGEIQDTVGQIREQYLVDNGAGHSRHLELRPYIVDAPDDILAKEPNRLYSKFRHLIGKVQSNTDNYSRSHIKQLRTVLKGQDAAISHYLQFHKIEPLVNSAYVGTFAPVDYSRVGGGKQQESRLFITTSDGESRCILFDAIEMMDTFLPVEAQQ